MPTLEPIEFLAPQTDNEPTAETAIETAVESPTLSVVKPPAQRQRIPAEYRLLTPEEVQTLLPVFDAQDAELPNLEKSVVVGAVKSGRVVGFIVLQWCLHCEPAWIEEGHSDVILGLTKATREEVEQSPTGVRVWMMADDQRTLMLGERLGMKREDLVVMTQWINPAQAKVEVVESSNLETATHQLSEDVIVNDDVDPNEAA